MRENHLGGKAESFWRPILLHPVIDDCTEHDRGLYTAQSQGKLQKCLNYQQYIRGNIGKSHKKVVKWRSKWRQSRLRKFATCEILQVAKICNAAKFM